MVLYDPLDFSGTLDHDIKSYYGGILMTITSAISVRVPQYHLRPNHILNRAVAHLGLLSLLIAPREGPSPPSLALK